MMDRFLDNSHGLREGAKRDVEYHERRGVTKSLQEQLYRRGLKESLMLTRLCLNRLNCALDCTVFLAAQSILNDIDVGRIIDQGDALIESGALKPDHPGTEAFLEQHSAWKKSVPNNQKSNRSISNKIKPVLDNRPILANDGVTPHEEESPAFASILALISDLALEHGGEMKE